MSTSQQSPIEDFRDMAALRTRVVELERENDLLKQNQRAHTVSSEGKQTPVTKVIPELELLRQIYGEAPIGLCYLDTNLRFVFINEWLAKINGLTVEEHLGRPISEILPDVAAGVEAQLRQVLESGEPIVEGAVEAETAAQQGVKRHFRHYYNAVISADGAIIGVSCVIQDVTERKEAEALIRESEERYRRLVSNINDALIIDDEEGRIVFANDRYLDLLGFTRQDLPTLEIEDFVAPQWCERLRGYHKQRLRGEKAPDRFEYEGRRKDGSSIWLEVCVTQIIESGKIVGTQSLIRDISERKRVEEELFEGRERLRQMTEHLAEASWLTEWASRKILYISPAYEQIWGLSCASLYASSRSWTDAIHKDDKERVVEAFERDAECGQYDIEYRITRPDGELRWIHERAFPILDSGGKTHRLAGISEDITERKRAETDLRDSEERFRIVFEASPSGMVIANADGKLLRFNSAMHKMLGFSEVEMRSMDVSQYTHADDVAEGRQLFADLCEGKRDHYQIEKRYIRKDGRVLWGNLAFTSVRNHQGEIQFLVASVQDITERKSAEEQARQLQVELHHMSRLSSMGEMASGLAHELNQPLTVITNYAEECIHLLESNSISKDELLNIMNRIATQAQRSGSIIRGLGDLVRKNSTLQTDIDVNQSIMEVAEMAKAEATLHYAKARFELEPKLPLVKANQTQFQQVLLNLVQNGCEASEDMPEARREVTVRTKRHGDSELEISVSDNGHGISESLGERLYEPFFTTKEEGIGMGLAISRSIVESHGGRLWATPNRGGGTTFHFTLSIVGVHDDDK